jgi:hypothetical protein
MENVGMFYAHVEYIKAIGIFYGHLVFCGNLVYFPPFRYIVSRKIWQPCSGPIFVPDLMAIINFNLSPQGSNLSPTGKGSPLSTYCSD